MRLIFIRHGDPDYSNDSLTERGQKEAAALTKRIDAMKISEVYASPLGRAYLTAKIACKNRPELQIKVLPWLKEFEARITLEDGIPRHVWDWKPSIWAETDGFYSKDEWSTTAFFKDSEEMRSLYNTAVSELDKLLKEKGYARENNHYKVIRSTHDTYVFFCHFAIECVFLSHLINVSPMILWQGFCAAPSGVTIVNTEEREKGISSFRISHFGDTSHLYSEGLEPSFAARFCECFDDDTRH
ncbi:MAG: histidine phosphatase family protein [Bacilli bacterium]|nr:histidine phosphatase family protein [Bacilli bacterium]